MFSLIDILKKTFLNESVNRSQIESAIKNRRRVALSYMGDPTHGVAPGVRYADIYSLIETKAGNIAVRAFQPYGDTASSVPNWKIFRLDRIQDWVETPYVIKEPAQGFNPNGDLGAQRVIMIANFGSGGPQIVEPRKQTTSDDVYRTDTEKAMRQKMDNLRDKLSDPVYIDQFLNREKEISNAPNNDNNKEDKPIDSVDNNLHRTDTEKGLERLKQQLDNPVYIDDYLNRNKKQSQEVGIKDEDDVDKVEVEDNIFKTDTEKQMERLKQQLNNPTFIDDFLNKK